MPAASAHRLRFLIGVALGAVLGAALLRGFVSDASREVADEAQERQAVVTLQALTSLVRRAGGEGDAVRSAVAAWQSRTPSAPQARVFRADGIRLEASTAPDDAGDRAAPRRLRREEKPLYDRSQRIAAAVQTNREEQQARKPEIEVAPAGARLSLAGPLEKNGAVVGIVEIETAPLPLPKPAGWSGFLLALIAPIAVFGGLAFLLGEKRLPLLAAAVVCVAASLSWMGRAAVSELAAQRQRAAEPTCTSRPPSWGWWCSSSTPSPTASRSRSPIRTCTTRARRSPTSGSACAITRTSSATSPSSREGTAARSSITSTSTGRFSSPSSGRSATSPSASRSG